MAQTYSTPTLVVNIVRRFGRVSALLGLLGLLSGCGGPDDKTTNASVCEPYTHSDPDTDFFYFDLDEGCYEITGVCAPMVDESWWPDPSSDVDWVGAQAGAGTISLSFEWSGGFSANSLRFYVEDLAAQEDVAVGVLTSSGAAEASGATDGGSVILFVVCTGPEAEHEYRATFVVP